MSEQAKCSGGCVEHVGAVVRVHVRNPRSGKDWGECDYCETAIKIDRANGFVVTIVEHAKGGAKIERSTP